MKVSFVGAGKVGFSLGRFFAERGIPVIGCWSRHRESAEEAAGFIGARAYDSLKDLVRDSDVIFLTVPDGVIKSMFQEIAKYDIENKQICHCSGAMSAEDAFPGIHEAGAYGCSIHPLFPVSSKYESYRELQDAFFCLQGDEEQIRIWEDWFKKQSVSVQKITAESKIRYHAACAIASNLVCGLIAQSLEMLESCGFSEEDALKAITPLVRSNIDHILEYGPEKALTGPVERCDVKTVSEHLKCFADKKDRMLYRSVTEKLIDIAGKKNPERDYTSMREIVKKSC